MRRKDLPAPKPGDWIRFLSGPQLIVGVVAYVRPTESWEHSDWEAVTDQGCTQTYLEIRHAD